MITVRFGAFVLAFLVVGSLAGACSDAYEEEAAEPADGGATAPDGAQASDAASDATTTDAGAPTAPPRPVPCPLVECPPSVDCIDDTCDDPDNGDYKRTGSTSLDAGTCTVTAPGGGDSSFHTTQEHGSGRVHVTLAFRLFAVEATERIIASVSSLGETWLIRARGGMLELCEQNAVGLRCTEPVAWTPGGTVHLYGIASPSSPPAASFALAVDEACSPARVLEATAPFTGPDVKASVGCLAGTAPCTITFDDASLAFTPE